MYTIKIDNISLEEELEEFGDIKKRVEELHQEYEWLTGSTWDWEGSIVYKDGRKIGKLSYNGRVWEGDKEVLG